MSEWLLAGALWAAKKTADKYYEIYFDASVMAETSKEIRSLRNEIMRLRDHKDKVTFLINTKNLFDHIIENYHAGT